MNPWDEDKVVEDLSPWDRDEQLAVEPIVSEGFSPSNIAKGIGRRASTLVGNIAGFAETAGEQMEEQYPIGGMAWQGEDVLPSYLPPEEYKQFQQENENSQILRKIQKGFKSVDFGYKPGTTWEQVKEADGFWSTAAELAPFALETGLVSLPDMAASVINMPVYFTSRSEEIAQDRAKNSGREGAPSSSDLAVGSTTAAIVAAMEKFGAERVFNSFLKGGTAPSKILKATIGEGGTEFVQEQIEYAGETVGTDKPFSPQESLERGLQGLAGGVAMGGTISTVGAGYSAARRVDPAVKSVEENANVINEALNRADKVRAATPVQPEIVEPQPVVDMKPVTERLDDIPAAIDTMEKPDVAMLDEILAKPIQPVTDELPAETRKLNSKGNLWKRKANAEMEKRRQKLGNDWVPVEEAEGWALHHESTIDKELDAIVKEDLAVKPDMPTGEEISADTLETLATHAENDLKAPTEAQIEADNYKKTPVNYDGLSIKVETAAGQKRKPEWPALKHHYGDIKLTEGADGDAVDVFINKDNERTDTPVFIVDQINPKTGKFDEGKILLGFGTEKDARIGYLANYEKNWQGLGGIHQASMEEFKDWLKNGDTTKEYKAREAREEEVSRIPDLVTDERKVSKPEKQEVQVLRGERDKGLPEMDKQLPEVLRRHGEETGIGKRVDAGKKQQRRELRAEELPVGDTERAGKKPEEQPLPDIEREKEIAGRMGRGARDKKADIADKDADLQMERREGVDDTGRVTKEDIKDADIQREDTADELLGERIRDKLQDIEKQDISAEVVDSKSADEKIVKESIEKYKSKDKVLSYLRGRYGKNRVKGSLGELVNKSFETDVVKPGKEKTTPETAPDKESKLEPKAKKSKEKPLEVKKQAKAPPAKAETVKEITGEPEAPRETLEKPDIERRADGDKRQERRVDRVARKRVSDMTEAEKDKALLTNEKSGLHNERAYEEDERLDFQSFFDIDNFKEINTQYTYEGADQILSAFGEVIQDAEQEGVTAYHLHGDEFIVQSNSEADLKAFSEKIQSELYDREIIIDIPGVDIKTATNIGASYGIGKTKEQAETSLKKDKDARAKAGLRSERGREPGRVPEAVAEGEGIEIKDEKELYLGYEIPETAARTPDSVREDVPEQRDLFAAAAVPDEAVKPQAADNFEVEFRHAEAAQLKSGFDVIDSPEKAAHLIAPIRKHAQETFMIIVTDKNKKVLNVIRHTKGGIASSSVFPTTVLGAIASTEGAANYWMAHNHPSGATVPSRSDYAITEKIVDASDGMDVNYEGHLVVGEGAAFDYFRYNDYSDRRSITPSKRSKTVSVTERVIKKRGRRDKTLLTSPPKTMEYVQNLDTESGILLLDNKHSVAGIIALTPDEMAKLRDGKQVKRILSGIDKTNAAAAITFVKQDLPGEDARFNLLNLGNFIARHEEIRLLDGLYFDSALNGLISMAERGIEPGSKDQPFYSRQKATGTKKAQVDDWISKPKSKLGNWISAEVVQTVDELPDGPHPGDVRGMRIGDTVYLVADNITDSKDSILVLSHEVVGHAGLERLLGKAGMASLVKQIQQYKRDGKKEITDIINELKLTYVDKNGKYNLSERQESSEVMAKLAEVNPDFGFVRKTLNKIKFWLTRHGFGRFVDFDDVHLESLLIRAAQTSQTDYSGFMEDGGKLVPSYMVAKDKVTDAEKSEYEQAVAKGLPMDKESRMERAKDMGFDVDTVWYHGTRREFKEFEVTKPRFARGNKRGIYFTKDKTEAEEYSLDEGEDYPDIRSRIVEVYLKDVEIFDPGYGNIQGIITNPENIRSINAAFDPDFKDSTNLLYSRKPQIESEFADQNKQLREEDVTVWDKSKLALRRQFAPGGNLPGDVFNSKITRDSEMEADEFDTRHLVGQLERVVKEKYGKRFKDLDTEVKSLLNKALKGSIDTSIPELVREKLYEMRQHIDNQSRELAATLLNRVSDLSGLSIHDILVMIKESKGDSEIISEKLKETSDLKTKQGRKDFSESITQSMRVMTIIGNMGEYVNRSYKVFDDPKWFKKLPDEVIDNAREYLRESYLESGMEEADADKQAERVLHEMLKTDTAYDSMSAFIAQSKLGAKDLSIMMQRKQIAPEIRALLGEYEDPRVNFAKSTSKMSHLIWNHRFLEKVKTNGVGVFLFEKDNKPPKATVKIAAESSEVMAPLNGYWTYPEIDQAFKDALGKENMDNWYRTIVQMNGMVKMGKTILSPTTAMRNWQSAMFFSLANGHFDLRHASKSLTGLREYFTQNGEPAKLAYLRKMKKLGVVYDTPYAGEMMRLMDDSRLEQVLIGKQGRFIDATRWIMENAKNFYSYGDDFWKIIGFENEKRLLMDAGLIESKAEKEAAERIRNTYPTYSMVGRGLQQLRRFPLAGTFVSFPAEIIRTSYHIMRYAAKDMKNPKMRKIGMRRMAGIAFVSSAAFALQQISASLMGIDDDEEDAIRELAAPWQKNSNLWFTGRDDKGHLQYFDISFVDPYNYWKRPINALLRDKPWQDKATDIAKEALSPFLGTDIAAGAIFEVMANKREGSGQPVFSEHDKPLSQLKDITNHLRKGLQPGIMSNVERTFKAVQGQRSPSGRVYNINDEMMAWAGWRMSTLDPKTALYYRSYEFKDQKREATIKLNSVIRDPNKITDSELKEARELSDQLREIAYKDFSKIVHAGRKSGLSEKQIIVILKNSGISSIDSKNLLEGSTPKWRPSKSGLRNAIKKARVLFSEDTAKEFKRRYEKVAED